MSERFCPSCAQSDATRPLREAAREPALAARLAAPRSPRHHGRSLGCGTMLISSVVAVTAAAAVAALVIAASAGLSPQPDSAAANAGVFSGILVFMVVFVAVFATFVWRQARADVRLRGQLARWHRAHERWEQLCYCQRCEAAFAPGQARLVAADEVQRYLYEEEAAPAAAAAGAG